MLTIGILTVCIAAATLLWGGAVVLVKLGHILAAVEKIPALLEKMDKIERLQNSDHDVLFRLARDHDQRVCTRRGLRNSPTPIILTPVAISEGNRT